MNKKINFKLLAITIKALDTNIYNNFISLCFKTICATNAILHKSYYHKTIIKYLLIKYIIQHKFNLQILIQQIIREYSKNINNHLINRYFTKFQYLYYQIFTYYENQSLLKFNFKELAIHSLYILYKITEKNTWEIIYLSIL